MDNVPYGSDTRDAPWNDRDSDFERIGTCKVCGSYIYEDDEFTEPDWGIYLCEDCDKYLDEY